MPVAPEQDTSLSVFTVFVDSLLHSQVSEVADASQQVAASPVPLCPRARHFSAIVHCVSGLTAAIEGITSSRRLAAGGSIASATVPRVSPSMSLFTVLFELTAATEGITGTGASH